MTSDLPTSTAATTALLAEDDECIREIVATYLERLGYFVLEAQNGQEALKLIEQKEGSHIDLIVTDILMPRVNGEEVVQAARARGVCDRFLFISGFTSEMAQAGRQIANDAAFLEKPFTFQAFAETVVRLRQALSRPNQEQP